MLYTPVIFTVKGTVVPLLSEKTKAQKLGVRLDHMTMPFQPIKPIECWQFHVVQPNTLPQDTELVNFEIKIPIQLCLSPKH